MFDPETHLATLNAIGLCNGCDAQPATPSSRGGYCIECEAEAMGATRQPVEALRVGDEVYLADQVVQLTSAPSGRATGYRGIGDPRIEVSAYGHALGVPRGALTSARHLSWPAGTLVLVARP